MIKTVEKPAFQPTSHRFTILTPTYNRAHLLGRTFASLCTQTFRDFEWLVVDDGSSDNTGMLVASWEADFPIRYQWQANRGKHTAVNLGVRLAAGEFIAQLDSDDECLPRALELFDNHWRRIPNPERFAGLVGLCVDEQGRNIGKAFPGEYADASTLGQSRRLVDGSERWGIIRTDVWRQFPAPEFPGERFIVERVVQNRIIQRYAVRYFNEVVRVYHKTADSLSNSGDYRWVNPRGACLYYRELAVARDVSFLTRAKSGINALRFMPLAAYRAMTGRFASPR